MPVVLPLHLTVSSSLLLMTEFRCGHFTLSQLWLSHHLVADGMCCHTSDKCEMGVENPGWSRVQLGLYVNFVPRRALRRRNLYFALGL